MTETRLHDNEVTVFPAQVRQLVDGQFPQWSGLPLRAVPSTGTDHWLYRLGPTHVMRLPRIGWAVEGIGREVVWLPRLAGHLRKTAIPRVLGHGRPAEGYPWPWSILGWLEGEVADHADVAQPSALAADIARFLADLRALPAAGAPRRLRGFAQMDRSLRVAVDKAGDRIDGRRVLAIWDAARAAGDSTGPPVWLHGDLAPGNLILRDGRLAGVIDWSYLGVGDPAIDLRIAWNLLPAAVRPGFLRTMGADGATIVRARALAMGQAAVQLPYYDTTNPGLAAQARHVIAEVLAEAEGAP